MDLHPVEAYAAATVTTILCIDGGGVRGIIPAKILAYLESLLMMLDGDDAKLPDYFDVMAGTSTGGLMATMLAASKRVNQALYAAEDISDFYIKNSPQIFRKPCGGCLSCFHYFRGPKYDGRSLRSKVREVVGDTRISQTLTEVVIPTYDIYRKEATIFSTSKAKRDVSMDALLSDICISTSAAPTYFPAHHFSTQKLNGELTEFNLIDGGVVANNPAFFAVRHALDNISSTSKLLVLSLGTGIAEPKNSISASETTGWGIFKWVGTLIHTFMRANAEMGDKTVDALLKKRPPGDTYLRIQDNTLTGHTSALDVTTEKNLRNLEKIAEQLLEKPVTRWIGEIPGETMEETNKEALIRIAMSLSDERKRRLRATKEETNKEAPTELVKLLSVKRNFRCQVDKGS